MVGNIAGLGFTYLMQYLISLDPGHAARAAAAAPGGDGLEWCALACDEFDTFTEAGGGVGLETGKVLRGGGRTLWPPKVTHFA